MSGDLMTAEEAERALLGCCPCPYCGRARRAVVALAAERERYRAALTQIASMGAAAGHSKERSRKSSRIARAALNPAEAP